MLLSLFTIITALALDQLLGEPRRLHPLVGFGGLASWLEKQLNQPHLSKAVTKALGLFAVLVLVSLPALFVFIVELLLSDFAQLLLAMVVVYFCIARRSLYEHARDVVAASGLSLECGRQAVAKIVSRDTQSMEQVEINRAVIESTLENGSDGIFAPLFWFLVAGLPGVVVYRAVNTLDAMWGYRTSRFKHFGWAAARLDDALNYIPARITATLYGLFGDWSQALYCWQQQARLCPSPNAGPVMCAGAGALHIRLGGATRYHGKMQQRPSMGCGDKATIDDITRSIGLLDRSLIGFLSFLGLFIVLLSVIKL